MPKLVTNIGIGHLIRAMQITGFGHNEIMTMRDAMITGDWSKINFCGDCYTADWDQSDQDRIKRRDAN